MPEWLVEHGIGETRAALVEDGRIVEARIELAGELVAGTVLEARLKSVGQNGRNAVATADGAEILLPSRSHGVTEGGPLRIEITRAAIPGAEPWKRPLGRATEAPAVAVRTLEERLSGRLLPFPPAGRDALQAAGWSDLLDEAASAVVDFSGGHLRLSLTPAMTLLDVDGWLPLEELAVAGARAAGEAIRRLAIGGSIGIDLPTTRGKAARAAAAEALDRALAGTPFERTAVNGFGFLQVVRPRVEASLLELAADRPAFAARRLLRNAVVSGHGACRLAAHPAVTAVLESRPEWIDQLSRQRGGTVALRADPTLAMSAGHVQPA